MRTSSTSAAPLEVVGSEVAPALDVSGAPELGLAVCSPATEPPGVGGADAVGLAVASGSTLPVGVAVGCAEADGVGVGFAVGAGVAVGVGLGAGVTSGAVDGVAVSAGDDVGAALAVGAGLAVGTGLEVGTDVAVGGGGAVGLAVGLALGEGVAVGAGVRVGAGLADEQSTLNTFCLSPPGCPFWLQNSLYWPSGSECRSGYGGTRTSADEPVDHVPLSTCCPPGCVAIRQAPDVPVPRKK